MRSSLQRQAWLREAMSESALLWYRMAVELLRETKNHTIIAANDEEIQFDPSPPVYAVNNRFDFIQSILASP